jgi:hypothetical protein
MICSPSNVRIESIFSHNTGARRGNQDMLVQELVCGNISWQPPQRVPLLAAGKRLPFETGFAAAGKQCRTARTMQTLLNLSAQRRLAPLPVARGTVYDECYEQHSSTLMDGSYAAAGMGRR